MSQVIPITEINSGQESETVEPEYTCSTRGRRQRSLTNPPLIYGFVMTIFLFLLLSFTTYSQEILQVPALTSPVIDQAHFLTQDENLRLSNKIRDLQKNQGIQAQILTIESLGSETIEQFSIRVVDEWKLGSKEQDNGLLFLVSKNDRKMRIEVGSGLEGDITDFISSKIIQQILTPNFKMSQFYQGFNDAIEYTSGVLSKDTQKTDALISVKKDPSYRAIIPFALFSFISVLFSFGARNKKTKSHSYIRGFLSSLFLTLPFLAMGIVSVIALSLIAVFGFIIGFFGFHQTGNYTSGGGNYRGGGFRSGGGSSWGGGGGGFSGGGASGDW